MAQTHHWKFNTATQFEDTIGSLDFSPYWGTWSIDDAGAINQCLLFPQYGGSGYALTQTNPIPASGPFSISFWIKAGTAEYLNTGSISLFQINSFNVSAEEYSGEWSPGLKRLRFEDYSLGGGYFVPGIAFRFGELWTSNTNGFTHFFISWDGTDWYVWINGDGGLLSYVAEGALFSFTESTRNNSNTLLIGSDGGAYDKRYDDFRIFNEVDENIKNFVYNNGIGTEVVYDPGAGNAYGSFPLIDLSGLSGSAGGGTGATGGLTTITVTPFSGSALFILDGSASGSFSTVTVSSFGGIAFPEFIAYGELATITVTSFEAIASSTATIQLDYVACDGEITWTQTLPITGFSSAIQGQDAISSRITPTIGASGASIVFFEQRTIAASGTYTYDLTSLTDFLGGALSLSRAYAISITPTSGTARLAPGASNPFQWFFASTTANISLSQGDAFMFAQPESATITSGSRTLVVTNTSGAASLTYKIAILGGR